MKFNAKQLQKKIQAEFSNLDLLEQALTHRSIGHKNNERLEYLGDAILGFVIADEIYSKFPTADEGVMSRLRAHLVNQTSLAEIATQLELSDELILGQGEMKSGGKHRASILSDVLEAIMGAMYKDSGIDPTREWILRVFKDKLKGLSLDTAIKDPKTQLQEYLQARNLKIPTYTVLSTTGADHNQLFTVECFVSQAGTPLSAKAGTRKKAEQKAADKVFNVLTNTSPP